MGVSRQPRTREAFFADDALEDAFALQARVRSTGRNVMPTPYSPAGGRVKPSLAHSRAKNLCGIWISTPAPSPVSGSQPQAPRWVRLMRT